MTDRMKKIETMTRNELLAERRHLQDALCDIEDMHHFTFGKTTAHIGAETAQQMQEAYEQERKELVAAIARVDELMARSGS